MQQSVLVDQEINLQNDAMFKAFMTNPNSRKMVSSVISELTGIDKKLLLKATYIGGEEIAKKNMHEKKQSTDMTIRINNRMQIIVEMNQFYTHDIFDKNSLYAMSRIVETTQPKKVYGNIILINIDNFNLFEEKEPIIEFYVQDKKGHLETKSYKSIHIVLANCKENTYNVGKETKKFARFLQEKKTIKELVKKYRGDEEYMSVIRTVEELSKDPEFAGYYDIEEKHRQQLESAKETGIDEGIQEGEHNAKISTAKKMLEDNMDIEIITKYTNLSSEEINQLKEEIQK